MKSVNRLIVAAAALGFIATSARGASPQLLRILPRGGQQGTEVDVSFDGQRLKDAQEVILYDNGLTVTKLEAEKPDQVKVHLKIDKQAPIGEHRMRLRCASGISELRTFWVGPFPQTQPTLNSGKGGNNQAANTSFETAQAVPMNVTVEGLLGNEQIHYYKIDAKKGQRISAEVEGIRLGMVLFDPYLAISDLKRVELAACDDTPLLKQDPFICMRAPKDGPFIIEVRDSAFGGGDKSHYRLHVGNFPRPHVLYPLGGQAGETVKVQFIGDPLGPIGKELKLPKETIEQMPVFAVQHGVTSPSPNLFRVSQFPDMTEGDAANHEIAKALEAKVELPVAFNGIISAPDENDYFKFKAHKGQPLEVTVHARSLGSPLDSVITIYGPKGQYLANNDDAGHPDSAIRFTPPEDGDYTVAIRDQLKAGGPEYVYRIEVTLSKPTVTLSIPNATQVNGPTQERQTIPVPRGNRYATLMRAAHPSVGGELEITAPQLPDGITMTTVPFNADTTIALFEAKTDAPVSGKLCDFGVQRAAAKAEAKPEADKDKPADAKDAEPIASTVNQQVELVISNPNNTAYSHTTVHKLAVAVTEEAPFTVQLIEPKAPLVQNGQIRMKVKAVRSGDFKGPITFRMLFDPPGVSAQPVEMPADKTEIDFPLSASEGAAIKTWKVALIATGNVDGPLWIATNLVDLHVAEPYMTGKIQMASAAQGGETQVVCELKQIVKFDGTAKVQLVGLPPNAKAEAQEITAEDTKVVFDVTTTAKTPVGQHTSLFVQSTLQKDGEDVIGSTAKGGVLRVDPAKKVAAATTKPAQAGAAKTAPKVQSALDKLREEQAAAQK